jgi:hypothetical protein
LVQVKESKGRGFVVASIWIVEFSAGVKVLMANRDSFIDSEEIKSTGYNRAGALVSARV